MALNNKQLDFIDDLQDLATTMKDHYGRCYNLKESFDELFSTGDSNDLSGVDLSEYGFDYTAITTFINQVTVQYQNFWTGAAVTTRQYGEDTRSVMK